MAEECNRPPPKLRVLFMAQIWDLESKSIVDELRLPADALPSNPGRKGRALAPFCVSLCW